eukprot:TRINITY_DN37812_c0_g1_i2.p1 TRINITY_DN37812_c0_g1~~TRINITY_DN37812_c0_g1_i2.p1  ORF type:complete len:116 (-),score=7.54 TRINITY_DN37812_c0_g1_i2:175-522(-)
MNAESAAGANGQDQPMIKWVDALRALEFLMEENDFNSAKGLVKKLLNGANVNREEVAVNETQWSKMFDELREEHYSRRRALASRLRVLGADREPHASGPNPTSLLVMLASRWSGT